MHGIFVFKTVYRITSAAISLLAAALLAQGVRAETFISAEPIPTGDVIGEQNLDRIETLSYQKMERWAIRVLEDCKVVDNVIAVLRDNHAIGAVNPHNTAVVVGAGGFQAITHPTFVLTIKDSGRGSVSAADVAVLDNALGYVLSQGGTVHFSPDHPVAYDFPLDYAVVTFSHPLSGIGAKNFFDFLGTIDLALWSGDFAGFTQINFNGSPINNSMLFLQPATTTEQFVHGLSTAAAATRGARYVPLDSAGNPTTALAGVSFPGNDWIAFPNGDQYLANLGSSSRRLLKDLAAIRKHHLHAVADLLEAIRKNKVDDYLNHQLDCD
jgi:hypothetical protein